MSDSYMTPAPLYAEVERCFGRPALDPCWHPKSPIRPHHAYTLWKFDCDWYQSDNQTGFWIREPNDPSSLKVTVLGKDGLAPTALWTDYQKDPKDWIWLNQPYSDSEPWLARLAIMPRSVCLSKFDPSTDWWTKHVWERRRWHVGEGSFFAVGMFNDRLLYPDATESTDPNGANFPSALIVRGLDYRKLKLRGITWITEWENK